MMTVAVVASFLMIKTMFAKIVWQLKLITVTPKK